MGLNPTGLVAGAVLFLGVWVGHVLVRKLEFISASILLPSACFGLAGVALVIGSFFAPAVISAMLGILGMTCLWDAYEFFRQQTRILKGHAPANRSNPRHARILKEYPPATPIDLLGRDPIGREVSKEDAINLIAKKGYSR